MICMPRPASWAGVLSVLAGIEEFSGTECLRALGPLSGPKKPYGFLKMAKARFP